MVDINQSHAIMAVLASNARWDQIDFSGSNLQKAVIQDAQGAGVRFTEFLQNGARMEKVERVIPVPTTAKEVEVGDKRSHGYRKLNVRQFFSDRPGLRTSKQFKSQILSQFCSGEGHYSWDPIAVYDMPGEYGDWNSISDFGTRCFQQDSSSALGLLADLIDGSSYADGLLDKNGRMNLLYAGGKVIYITCDLRGKGGMYLDSAEILVNCTRFRNPRLICRKF